MSQSVIENLIKQVKNELQTEIKFLLKYLNNQNIVVVNTILKNGFITGSIFINTFYKIKSDDSDIDIFTVYDEKIISKLKNDLKASNIEFENVTFTDDDGYKNDKNNKVAIKFNIGGKIKQKKVDIIFNDSFWIQKNTNVLIKHPEIITNKFDFRICDWYYDYFDNEMYLSNLCIEDLEKRELNFSSFFENKINLAIIDFNNQQPQDLLSLLGIISKRIDKYNNIKKIIMSEPTKELYEKIVDLSEKYILKK